MTSHLFLSSTLDIRNKIVNFHCKPLSWNILKVTVQPKWKQKTAVNWFSGEKTFTRSLILSTKVWFLGWTVPLMIPVKLQRGWKYWMFGTQTIKRKKTAWRLFSKSELFHHISFQVFNRKEEISEKFNPNADGKSAEIAFRKKQPGEMTWG